MTDSERLKEIIDSSKMSARAFSEHIGLKSPQTLYDIAKGKHGISKNLGELIHAKYLNYNLAWILTGEGEMYNSPTYRDNPFNIAENNVKNSKEPYIPSSRMDQMLDIMSSQQRTIETQSKTIEELLKKNNGTNGNGKNASSA